jgi:hypothetical protein
MENRQPMQEINLRVTIEDANLILEGLGNLPFARVYGLVGKIQEQAGQQLNRNNSNQEESAAPDQAREGVK